MFIWTGSPKSARLNISSRSEEHTSELQSPCNLVCRLLLEKKKKNITHLKWSIRKPMTPITGQAGFRCQHHISLTTTFYFPYRNKILYAVDCQSIVQTPASYHEPYTGA